MVLSVIIVNYNVKYFLKQCLASVFGSQRTLADSTGLELDVWVVDNDSVDGSVEMVRKDFPQIHVIENHENVGFARANNQALAHCAGQCLLLLNPDTIVEPDTFVRCVDFMHSHPDCGGLCVKMVDGKGTYLKESKRGFPTPEASFYKISGLTSLFPHSRRFAAYYMGHLSEDEVGEIEIMPGAFLMLRREVYDQIGGLDESYFMYGEDIDFSWRIHLAGWKNYYLPETHIIHYKGESTKKGSMNYVYTFYNAMAIFVRKYFTGRNARHFNALLQSAIWLRATVSWLQRIASRLAVPLMDFALAFGGFVLLKELWSSFRAAGVDYYPLQYTLFVIPCYILILMCCSWLQGGYDKPVRPLRIVRGMGVGIVLLLAFYSLLDEDLRYSRMLLLAGSLWTLASTLLVRCLLSAMDIKGYALRAHKRGRVLIVGSEQETSRVKELYQTLSTHSTSFITHHSSLNTQHLQDLIRIQHIEEVIFCGADITLQQIIDLMATLKTTGVEYKIAPAAGDFIIGSNSILSPDALYLDNLDTVSTATCRRNKRLFDIATSLLMLLLSPILIWFQRHKRLYFTHCLSVLAGRRSWVGHTGRQGVFSPADITDNASPEVRDRLMLRYMRHYKTSTDAAILLRNWRNLKSHTLGITLCVSLFFILQSSFFTPASAQRIHGFVSAGATLSQIEGDELRGFRMLGFTGGVGAIASLDRYGDWRISVEAIYSRRGAFNNSSDPFRIALPLSYVDIPLMLHYRDPWGGLLIGLGLSYGRLVEQPHSKLIYDKNYFFPDTTDMKFLNNDFMVVADIRFPIWRGLWFDIRWQYSLVAVKKDWEFTEYRGYDNEGNPKAVRWKNDCYNNQLTFRLLWQF